MRDLPSSVQFPAEQPSGLLIAATSTALLTLLPVAAHQLGLFEHLPDPPGAVFASDRITESKTAHPLGVPDSLLGLGSYGITLCLAILSLSQPKVRPLLAAKLVADGGVATFNVVRQIVSFRRVCSWCTGTAIATAVMVYAGRDLIRQQAGRMRQEI
jgi:uncharacterized membrane protein